ncbi:MAG: ATP-binding protein [Bdellovibrionota bacterium]|jgi:nitrogen fixation/metabolism regulation signal transduction histidine kinase
MNRSRQEKVWSEESEFEQRILVEVIERTAHRVGNSLQVIQSGINRIGRRVSNSTGVDSSPASSREEYDFLPLMQEATDNILVIFRTLQEFSQPMTFVKESRDLLVLLEEVLDSLPDGQEVIHASIQVENPHQAYRAFIDDGKLREVVRILVENAVQSASGERNIYFSLGLRSYDSQPHIEILVGDDGPGFEEEGVQNAFSVFYTSRKQTFGFGLARAKRIIEGHGGFIQLLVDKRERVKILLPIK